MSMWKRAAQFAPFAAMEGYKEAIEKVNKESECAYETQYVDEW